MAHAPSPFKLPSWAGVSGDTSPWTIEGLSESPIPIHERAHYLLGRSRDPGFDVDFVLESPDVSSRHAALVHHGEQNVLYVIDLSSRKGTYDDGSKIPPNKPTKVRNGPELQVGPHKFRCVNPGAPAASTSPEKRQARTIRASHVLVKHVGSRNPSSWREPVITRSKEEAERMVEAHRTQIIAGTAFDIVAQSNSDCSSAKRGGDLGPFGRGQMQAEFEEAAFALQVGELSQPVHTASGVHIILRTA